ncbi:hypothetical protein GDO86_007748 [Hymenochirus boettgeri]|uniref:Palmdelphin n=1 Tax=Hymenochirus boettgeri TaxID=247094 RepID=A0A8T2J292_9PIPI|nr:hypothetical protein GDO86_007748 [Hymenochirus boettgeri]
MEEAELLKERLQAITDKRKLQEDIAQKRVKIEEEKIKHHHLKKKALREKWLLDGLSSLTAEEHQNMLQQNEEDQQQIKHLELIIDRLEQEIDALEKEEVQLSAKEVRVLQRLKSVERSTEDIIKAAKAQMQEEPLCDIYAGIPDLPPSYKPSFVRKLETQDNEDEPRKALFAMEIKVEKDIKSGKSTVLSSIPVPSSEFQDTGVKVYDDGRKSVYAVRSEGKAKQNGVDPLAPIEVEDLLRKATEKHSESPTEYHEPVFSNSYSNSETQRGHIAPRMKKQNSPSDINSWNQNGLSTKETLSNPSTPREVYQIKGPFPEEERFSQCQTSVMPQKQQPMSEFTEHMLTPLADHHEHLKSMEGCTTESPSSALRIRMAKLGKKVI